MLKIFIGFDPRQPVSYNVLQQSIFTRSSKPVSITPLVIEQLPMTRVGLTPFTYTRFLVPWLCNFEGWALFLDIDMLLLDDISKLFDLKDDKYAVQVVKNPDPSMGFERASVMLFNCAKCKILTPEYVETAKNLHVLKWAEEAEIGGLPLEWNHLVGYDAYNSNAKLIHYTQGIPYFKETIESDFAREWQAELKVMNHSQPWAELMGNSVHSVHVDGKPIPKFVAKKLIAEGKIYERKD